MSDVLIGTKEYTCFNDCKETGCPGHRVSVIYTTMFNIAIKQEAFGDDESLPKPYAYFDRNELRAIRNICIENGFE